MIKEVILAINTGIANGNSGTFSSWSIVISIGCDHKNTLVQVPFTSPSISPTAANLYDPGIIDETKLVFKRKIGEGLF